MMSDFISFYFFYFFLGGGHLDKIASALAGVKKIVNGGGRG